MRILGLEVSINYTWISLVHRYAYMAYCVHLKNIVCMLYPLIMLLQGKERGSTKLFQHKSSICSFVFKLFQGGVVVGVVWKPRTSIKRLNITGERTFFVSCLLISKPVHLMYMSIYI